MEGTGHSNDQMPAVQVFPINGTDDEVRTITTCDVSAGPSAIGAAQENESAIMLYFGIVQLNNAVILDGICPFLATSACAQDNGIACCNRATNIAWRRMFFPFLRWWLDGIMKYVVKPKAHKGTVSLLLADFADILGMETGALVKRER